ncbi:tripartite tricarboxylate transporter TctB family protein [Pseudotabrizicola formosa]|uniref:tripartite tricarboxylate transporter TctB family protein n=1 Tax=Pseudotabrizicola formosa TaxID=2030009 RepID=UPI000CD15BB4|nr:tripartite tricarboxylate transporter TctB family protein [Pseudotabrizicola formosa]
MTKFLMAAPAIFMITLALGVILGTQGLRFWDGMTPGARFLPGWLAGAAIVLSATLLLTQWRGTDAGAPDLPDAPGARRVGATLIALIILGLMIPVLGMVPAVAIFILFQLLIVQRAAALPSLVTAGIISVGIEMIFARWLGVPLPAPFF